MSEEELSDANLIAALERAYSATIVPPCRICGAPLAIATCGGGEPTKYRCSVMSGAPHNGVPMDWNHYEHSGWTDYRQGGDEHVIELIRRYRAAAERLDQLAGLRDPRLGV